jgi:4'-phosphopantetheinyl transferase
MLPPTRCDVQETPSLIDVWSAAASADRPGEVERCCEAWLTADERVRADRFRKDTTRNQHVVGRGMTRKLLGDRVIDPERIELGFMPHGKPFVVAPPQAACPFNVAHTDGLVLFASCRSEQPRAGMTLGVDVERLSRRTDVELAQRYFAAPEVQYVWDHRDPDARRYAFLRVWTLKEAFIKAIGTGLTMPLGDFAFEQIDSDRPRVRMLNPALETGEHWQFIAFHPAEDYIGALAVSGLPAGQPVSFRLRRFESLLGLSPASPPSATLPSATLPSAPPPRPAPTVR